MSSTPSEPEYSICSSCSPKIESIVDDMTKHISKEISLLRVNSPGLLDEGISPSKLQPFPKSLGRFLTKVLTDLKKNEIDLVQTYCKDLLSFTETINYKTRGSGNQRNSKFCLISIFYDLKRRGDWTSSYFMT